jgi:predicted O-methyltransferase YrrM
VKGYLRVADALALYEIAYLADGDVLDVGTAWGLSASVMARALEARGGTGRVVSVEADAGMHGHAVAEMEGLGLAARFEGMLGDAAVVLPQMAKEGRRFGAAFIDHDHRHAAQEAALAAVAALLVQGGWVLVHDFNYPNNAAHPEEFGIYRAVADAVANGTFAFAGVVGCCALLRKVG